MLQGTDLGMASLPGEELSDAWLILTCKQGGSRTFQTEFDATR